MVRRTIEKIRLYCCSIVSEEKNADETETKPEETEKKSDEDAAVEDVKEEEKKKKTKKVDKTIWEWELMNESKPIWQRK